MSDDPVLSKHDDDLAVFMLNQGMREQVRYDHARSTWHYWDKHRWRRDQTEAVFDKLFRLTVKFVKVITGEKQKILFSLFDRGKKESVLKAMRSMEPIAMSGEEWDTDPYLLGCKNGILDLRTLEFHTEPHPEWLVTRSTNVNWNPEAGEATKFNAFVHEIMGEDPELVYYLLCTLGYSLFGFQREQKFWMWAGGGNNGKGTLAKVVSYVLGQYADTPSAELYMKSKHGAISASAPRAELVKLQGIRFAWMSEPQGGAFNDELVKAHTGDDPIQARPLYSNDFITFRPSHTIVFLVNELPRTEDVGVSMKRRARVIRFEQDFSAVMDMQLEEKLREEGEQILLLLAHFAAYWFKHGLKEPKKVTDWASEYIEENDPLARFLGERCIVGRNLSTVGVLLYDSYVDWCHANNEEPKSNRGFGIQASKQFKNVKTRTGVVYQGVGLKSAMTLALEEAPDDGEENT